MMTKFYVVEISEGDSKIEGKAIYEYSTMNDAVASFHTKLGNAMRSDLYTSELVMVIDEDGIQYKQEHYKAPEENDTNSTSERN